PRVHENAHVLLAGYRNIAESVLAKHEITPAAEWILDNFHVVDEQLRGIRDHLPRSYYRLLPKISAGHLAGYPRVFGLAWAYAALARAFAVQLVRRRRGQDPSVRPALAWLGKRLTRQETSADEVVAREHQAQAAANVTVRNIITSMRWMSSIGWPEFFESVSLVDDILRTAPGFAAMDFTTRDQYRARIELLSRGSGRSEIEVAR